MSNQTDLEGFLSELGGGVFREKLALILSEVALATVTNANGGKKGKVSVEFSMSRVGENDQVIIEHKLSHVTPTKRGKKTEEDITETPMFVGVGGKLTIDQPKEDNDGQFALGESVTSIHNRNQ